MGEIGNLYPPPPKECGLGVMARGVLRVGHKESGNLDPPPLNNEGSGLWLEGYEGWDIGWPLLCFGPSPKRMSDPFQ